MFLPFFLGLWAASLLGLASSSSSSLHLHADSHSTSCPSAGVECLVGRGLIPDSTLGLTEILWVGPESKGIYIGSPSIWRMPASRKGSYDVPPLFASHDFFGHSTLEATVQVFIDPSGLGDGPNAKWRYAGNVSGMYWANLFTSPNEEDEGLYLLGVSDGDDASVRHIVISRSTDLGVTWTKPSILFKSNQTDNVYHCAPTPTILASDGRLYRAFESSFPEEAASYSRAFAISTVNPVVDSFVNGKAEEVVDLLSPSSWRMLPIATFDRGKMIPTDWDQDGKYFWQEGNAVEWNGKLYDVLRIDGQTSKTNSKAAIIRYDNVLLSNNRTPLHEIPKAAVAFDRMIDFPSTSSKFVIRKDPLSGADSASIFFLSIVNDVTDRNQETGNVYARNHLSLAVSAPGTLYNWTLCAVLLTDDTGIAGNAGISAAYTGFHYVDWIFDGDDILYAIRTGYRGSNSYHNANRMTVKRIKNYRSLFDPVTGRCSKGTAAYN